MCFTLPSISISSLGSAVFDFVALHRDDSFSLNRELPASICGGMVMVCPLFQRVLVQECRQENIPVIFYEVFAQCRRLGVQSAAELLKFYPDIVCSSKLLTGGSIPLSATLATEDVFEVFQGKSKVPAKALDLGEFITVVLNLSCIDCELQPSQGESGYASTSSKEIIKKSKEGWDLCKAIGECAIPYVWTFDTPENL